MKTAVLLAGLMSCFLGAAFGQTQLIVNGGFETQTKGEWVVSGQGANLLNNPALAHSGQGYLGLGGASGGAQQKVYQVITIPSNTVMAQLSYYYDIYSPFANAGDLLGVYVLYTNGNYAAQVDAKTGANSTGGQGSSFYRLMTYNLTPWAGQTIEIAFFAQTAGATLFNIDDVNVWVETTADVPPNDYFANSTTLVGSSVMAQGNNTFATKETGEPNHAGNAGGDSLWWNWTATNNGVVTLSTYGSSFPCLLAVYTGSTVSNLTRVASAAADPNNTSPAQLKFPATTGTQYQIAVDGRDGAYGKVALTLSFQPDTQPPLVTITSPAANAKVTNATVVVLGTVSDNVSLGGVLYRLENAAGTNDYQTATFSNRWAAAISNLWPGLNTVRVFAYDASSNLSATVARTFTYAPVTPLVLATNGLGTVSPKLNGAALEVNKSYTVTATPLKGNIFASWTDGEGNVLANTPKYTFTMTTGLVLRANFIPNPFIPIQGNYAGLFAADTNSITTTNAGAFTASLTSLGGLTAKLLLGGATYSLSGPFFADGTFSKTIVGPGRIPLTVQLQLDLAGGQTLSGTVSNSYWQADLVAYRAVYSRTHPAPQSGRKYTLVIPGTADSAAGPGGNCYGTLTVDGSGNFRFQGTLGDGVAVSQSCFVSSQGSWPLYLSANAGKEIVWGWLTFATSQDYDITGQVRWLKQPGVPGKFYPNGFVFGNELEVMGSIYVQSNGVPALNWTNGVLVLEGGNLAASGLQNNMSWGLSAKASGPNKLNLTLTPASGLFQGSVLNPQTGKPISLKGVLLQNHNVGYGLFQGTNQTGSVSFGPQ